MAVIFIPYQPQYDAYFNTPGGQVGRYLARRGRRVRDAARRQVGVSTGALRASIHMRHYRDTRGQVIKIGSSLPYAKAHHNGTKAHVITPSKRRALRFFSKGVLIFTRSVMHPGTKPNRYLTDNLKLILL